MTQFEIHIHNALGKLANTLQRQWHEEKLAATLEEKATMDTQLEITRLKTEIADLRDDLSTLQFDAPIVLGTKAVKENFGFFKNFVFLGQIELGTRKIEYDSDSPISYVSKSVTGGSKWLSEDLRRTSWKGVLTAGLFRSINGTATFYTTIALKNRDQIQELQATCKAKEAQVAYLKPKIDEHKEDKSVKSTKLGEEMEKCKSLMSILEKDTFEMQLYPLLRRFYCAGGAPSRNEIHDFVKVYDSFVAELWWNMGLAEK
jgi:hypothetical protein